MSQPFNLTPHNLKYAHAKLDLLDLSTPHQMILRPTEKQRTLAQNDWARKFARDCSTYFGYSADEMYQILMYRHNPSFKIDPETNQTIRLPGSFSSLDTKDAARVQEEILKWSIDMGFIWNET